jgi:hypothetical protein
MASIGLEFLGACFVAVTIYLLWAAGPSKNGRIRRFAMSKGVAPMYPIMLMALFIAGASLMAAGFGVPIGLLSAKPA